MLSWSKIWKLWVERPHRLECNSISVHRRYYCSLTHCMYRQSDCWHCHQFAAVAHDCMEPVSQWVCHFKGTLCWTLALRSRVGCINRAHIAARTARISNYAVTTCNYLGLLWGCNKIVRTGNLWTEFTVSSARSRVSLVLSLQRFIITTSPCKQSEWPSGQSIFLFCFWDWQNWASHSSIRSVCMVQSTFKKKQNYGVAWRSLY